MKKENVKVENFLQIYLEINFRLCTFTVLFNKQTKIMQIKIKPQIITGQLTWKSKCQGVVFVQKQEDIEPVWRALCAQDEYWKSYKNLIKVGPTEIDSKHDLEKYCEYCGETDIYYVRKLIQDLKEKGIEILLFQYQEKH